MNEQTSTKQNIIFFTALGVIAVIVILYFVMRSPSPTEPAIIEVDTVDQQKNQSVLKGVALIKSMQMNTQFLESSGYQALRDVTVDVPLVTPPGRPNPFLGF